MPLRKAKAQFSMLVARAQLLNELTVLNKHGRAAAAIVSAQAGLATTEAAELWQLLGRLCPPEQDAAVDELRARSASATSSQTIHDGRRMQAGRMRVAQSAGGGDGPESQARIVGRSGSDDGPGSHRSDAAADETLAMDGGLRR